ncbi:SIS domain-containing protein [uncultured Treponema sp.]|uniref:D-sedoheptulose-7-phosphate isomerase n=1 Tax=uncultured Treponema sp. TaxID=162155 RepID=UPI0025CF9EEB|nr:SIS domain-containing protein [uncultured Treponema sp.]
MDYIKQLIERYPALSVCENDIRKAAKAIINSYEKGGKLLVAGNGGSAADSDHITGELLKSFVKIRKPSNDFLAKLKEIDPDTGTYLSDKLQGSLPAIALTNQSALMTASLNDVDGNVMFAQQVNGFGKPEDVFLGITTSGNSADVIYATVVAKAKGLKTIALTGKSGGKIKDLSDITIIVPSNETFMIQEYHLPVYHALCLEIEEHFWKE